MAVLDELPDGGWPELLGYISLGLAVLGELLYIVSVVWGKTRPSRSTWAIWFMLSTLTAVSYYYVGARDTLWPAIALAVGAGVTCALSIPYGVGGWSLEKRPFTVLIPWKVAGKNVWVELRDVAMCAGAVIGALVWHLADSTLALLAFLTADFFGVIPTVIKVYQRPWDEEWWPWAVTVVAYVVLVLALDITHAPAWELGIAAYPFYMVCMNGTILFFILRPRFGHLANVASEIRDT